LKNPKQLFDSYFKLNIDHKNQISNITESVGNSLFSFTDTFINAVTGYGTKRDKTNNTYFSPKEKTPHQELDLMYSQIPLLRKITKTKVDYMLKEGFEINHDNVDQINDVYEKLDIIKEIHKALIYSRLHGGGFCLLIINDGQDQSEPLNYENIKSIDQVVTVPSTYLQPYDRYVKFQKVDKWSLTSERDIVMHRSRVLRFDGIDAGEDLRASNNGHGESFIDSLLGEVIDVIMMYKASFNIIQEYNQGIYGIKGLNSLVSPKRINELQNKLTSQDIAKSIINKLVIDSEDTYTNQNININGLQPLIKELRTLLCASSEMPHTLLFGESDNGGLGAKGEGQLTDWYDQIKIAQENELKPNLKKLNYIIAKMLKIDDKISIKFNPLTQKSQKELLEERFIQTDIDLKLIQLGVKQEDILNSRFGGKEYSYETLYTGMNKKISNKNDKNYNNVV
jgi:phage-related protein (TIGR01555 family)